MKKIKFIIMLFLGVFFFSKADAQVPEIVNSSFLKKYPDAANIKWQQESETEWEANYKWNGKFYSSNYSTNGAWLETESPITFVALPEKVKTAFNAEHKAEKVKSVMIIETAAGQTKYEIEVRKGVRPTEYFYSADGVVIKK